MKIITDERCIGYSSPGHPERPARISKTLEKLRSQNELSITWAEPLPVTEEILLRAHTKSHLDRVKGAADAFDADTPAHAGIFEHACRSVGSRTALENHRGLDCKPLSATEWVASVALWLVALALCMGVIAFASVGTGRLS